MIYLCTFSGTDFSVWTKLNGVITDETVLAIGKFYRARKGSKKIGIFYASRNKIRRSWVAVVKWQCGPGDRWSKSHNLLGQVGSVNFTWDYPTMDRFVHMDIFTRLRKPLKIRTKAWGLAACNRLGYKVV